MRGMMIITEMKRMRKSQQEQDKVSVRRTSGRVVKNKKTTWDKMGCKIGIVLELVKKLL